jgi:hypothetical protein
MCASEKLTRPLKQIKKAYFPLKAPAGIPVYLLKNRDSLLTIRIIRGAFH